MTSISVKQPFDVSEPSVRVKMLKEGISLKAIEMWFLDQRGLQIINTPLLSEVVLDHEQL